MTGTGIIIVLIAIGVTIAAHFSQMNAEEKSAGNWVSFAQRHGLALERGFIQGTYQGYPLAVDTQERRIGKNTYRVTIVHLRLPALPHQAALKRGGLMDGPVRVENSTPSADALLKQPRVQQCLSAVAGAYQDFYIQDGFIHAERAVLMKSVEHMESFIAPALELARALDEAAKAPQAAQA